MKRFERKFGEAFLKSIPRAPGVYFVYNDAGEVIYVGKAKNLRRRLSQYRAAKRSKRGRKMRKIIDESARISFTELPSDLDACLEEVKHIQTYRPKWNIASAYSFLYPMIGVFKCPAGLRFCLTTLPDRFSSYTLFGSFRSRRLAREAMRALMRLLAYVGHPMSRSELGEDLGHQYSFVFGFRRLPTDWTELWSRFFRGESDEALEVLCLRLTENAGARARSEDIQENLNHLRRFFKREAKLLEKAIAATGHATYPVPQRERDLLLLRFREMRLK